MASLKNIKIMKYKVYGIDTLIEFGRYKGKMMIDIDIEDKKYLEWFLEEIDNVALDRELFNNDIIQSLPKNVISILEERMDNSEYIHSKYIYFSKKIEENVSILKRFSKTNRIILVSNCRRARGMETLEYHQLDKYFYRMFFLEDRMLSENKYENAIRDLGVSSHDIIAFEDDDKEIENAQKVGIKDINVDVETNLKDLAYNIFEKFTDKLLFYQNDDAKIRVEIEKDTLEYLLKDREENIYIDESIYYFPKKEGESFQPEGKKYRILKGGLKEFIIDPNLFLKQK